MSNVETTGADARRMTQHVPDLPLVVWMVLLTLVLGLAAGFDATRVVSEFNLGFGRALGEFALILLPSFTLAAALSQQNAISEAAGRTAALVSPVAGAAMICPDTAYAALSPAAGRYKLDAAFGAYAGFKLLAPAGPLIVAAGGGLTGPNGLSFATLLISGAALMLPVWGVGVVWARLFAGAEAKAVATQHSRNPSRLMQTFAPFVVMAVLLILGSLVGATGIGVMDFFLMPKGALITAATLALLQLSPEKRRGCLDSAVRRTGALLLVIGAASAFGAVLTGLLDLERLVPQGSGMTTVIGLFALTVLFKLAQGSSMATFAAIAPVAAPIVAATGVNELAAIFAICLGSFVSILPNDSYYWLVRRDAFEAESGERHVMFVLSLGAIVQASVGMLLLMIWVYLWA